MSFDMARRNMYLAITELHRRIAQWEAEGAELQQQVCQIGMAVFMDNRPLTAEEEAWAAKMAREHEERLKREAADER